MPDGSNSPMTSRHRHRAKRQDGIRPLHRWLPTAPSSTARATATSRSVPPGQGQVIKGWDEGVAA
jgi:hypothetical protein